MITSTRNARIQWVRSLQAKGRARRESRAFVVEGVRLVEEALSAGSRPELVLYTEDPNPRAASILEGFRELGADLVQVAPHVMKAASETRTPQGLLAVVPLEPGDLPPPCDLILVLDGVRDPGNLGTILRTAASAGAGAVLLAPGSADPYAPKVVRAAMGAHFRLPLFPANWTQIQQYLARSLPPSSGAVYQAEANQGLSYVDVDLRSPLALLVGGEAHGAGPEAAALDPIPIHIPMPSGGESLNVAVATGILLFEVARQRHS